METKERIKRDNKKAFVPFILLVLLGGVCGGLVGGFSEYLSGKHLDNVITMLGAGLKISIPYILIGIGLVTLIPGFIIFFIQKSKYKKGNLSDDELDRVEHVLGYPLILSSIQMITSFFFFGCVLVFMDDMTEFAGGVATLAFIGFIAIEVVLQKLVIDFERILNPQKSGSVFDKKFADKWENSCDEAERLAMYKSAYKAYKTTTFTCIIVWMCVVISNLFFNTGVLPVLVVTVIWLVQTLSYSLTAMKLDRAKMNQ